jgi:hypothetical protein
MPRATLSPLAVGYTGMEIVSRPDQFALVGSDRAIRQLEQLPDCDIVAVYPWPYTWAWWRALWLLIRQEAGDAFRRTSNGCPGRSDNGPHLWRFGVATLADPQGEKLHCTYCPATADRSS